MKTFNVHRLPGARPVVCDIHSSQSASNQVIAKMQQLLPILQPANVTVNTVMPFMQLSISMPSFSTTLPRESLNSVNGTNLTCS